MRCLRHFLFPGFVVLLTLDAPAAGQSWIGKGSGSWNVANNWSPGLFVPNSSMNTQLDFGSTIFNPAMTNNIPGTFMLNRMTFDSGGPVYTLNGNPLDFRTNSSFIAPRIVQNSANSLTLANSLILTSSFSVTGAGAGPVTFNGPISGIGGLTYAGAGTLTLGNGANTYGLGTVVQSGTLALGDGDAIPTGGSLLVAAGATFSTGGLGNSAATGLGTVTLDGTFRVPSGSADFYINQLAMGGSTGATVDFTGATSADLHITGAGITVGSVLFHTWTGGGTSRIVNDSSSPLDINFIGFQILTSSVILANGAGGQGFRLTGTDGEMVLTNTGNTANLIVDQSAGLRVGDMAFLGSGSLTLQDQGALVYTGASASSTKPITLGSGGGQFRVNTTGSNLTLGGVISGSALVVGGDGQSTPGATLTLTANNTYTGPTWVGDGAILSIAGIANGGVASPIGASSTDPANLVLAYHPSNSSGSGTLRYTGPTASTNRGMWLYNSLSKIDVTAAATNLTVTGQFYGAGWLSKDGPGTLTLANSSNIYDGATIIHAGRLAIGATGAALPTGRTVALHPGTELNLGSFNNFASTALGQVAIDGGTFRKPAGGGDYYINNLFCHTSLGGTVDFSGTNAFTLRFVNSGAYIAAFGNSTFVAGTSSTLRNDTGATMDVIVSSGVTLTNGIALTGSNFRITGGGTLYQTGLVSGPSLTVENSRLRIDFVGVLTLGAGSLTLDGGTLQYGGTTINLTKPLYLAAGGGTVDVSNPATTLTLTGATFGTGAFVKTGPGVAVLSNTSNQYLGGITVSGGRLDIAGDNLLGLANPTVNAAGTLRYTASASTARTFNLFNGTLETPAGVTLTLNGATASGGFLRGSGTYNLTGGTSLIGVTTFTGTNLSVTGSASITNFSHNGNLTVNSGQTLTMNYGTNGSAGRMTINGTANVTEFVSNGLLTVPNGGLINNTLSNMVLGGGSTTFVGAVGNLGGKIDLGGLQLHVRGGLLVTNAGTFASGNGVRNGTTVADYGALVKGTGPYQSVITQNGGQYLPGNSPGTSQVGDFFINPGGNLIFQITDAGPSLTFPSAPGIAGMNPGWGLTQVFTSMNFTATPASPYTITMQTQLPPPAAPDTPGLMSSFDPNRAYQWLIFDLQPGAVFNGTFDPNAINFATAQFVNSTMGGTFSLARTGGQIFLTFTPVPEPVFLLGIASVGGIALGVWRRSRRSSRR